MPELAGEGGRADVDAAVRSAAVKALLLVALVACGKPQSLPTLPIAVVSWPSPVRPQCYLPDLPPPPTVTAYAVGDDYARLYVRAGEMQELRRWLADVAQVIGVHNACLGKLADPK